MSLIRSLPSNADQQQQSLESNKDNAGEAQRHDRQHSARHLTSGMAGSSGGVATDISAAQKMISATWGSILTSLLGMHRKSLDYNKSDS